MGSRKKRKKAGLKSGAFGKPHGRVTYRGHRVRRGGYSVDVHHLCSRTAKGRTLSTTKSAQIREGVFYARAKTCLSQTTHVTPPLGRVPTAAQLFAGLFGVSSGGTFLGCGNNSRRRSFLYLRWRTKSLQITRTARGCLSKLKFALKVVIFQDKFLQ
ncbi:hypothetical protein CEXT_172991 [Caerostris extrusa]|uniref:Uncharacterized protein n=1 Tax=Caerostris extrusa TaxID=172846 RepID=A0AAV4P6A8_CAEEX|nr:hypothetical protein CEXT_172991 [Caerostris extrusa]